MEPSSLLSPQLRRVAIQFCKDIPKSVVEGIMLRQIPRPFPSLALLATLLISAVGVTAPPTTARADDCLTAPNSDAPQGSHWYHYVDRATQRKCWYVRAPGAQQVAAPATTGPATPLHSTSAPPEPKSDGAPMSISPGDSAAPLPHVKILAVRPKSAHVITATTGKPVRRSEQEGNTTTPSIPEAPAAQESASWQTSAQATGPAPAAPPVRPDASPVVATVEALKPIAVPTDAAADLVSDDAERTARRTDLPMIIFLLQSLSPR